MKKEKAIYNLKTILNKNSKLSLKEDKYIIEADESGEINAFLAEDLNNLNQILIDGFEASNKGDISNIIKGLEKVTDLVQKVYNKKQFIVPIKKTSERIVNNYLNVVLKESIKVSKILNSYYHIANEKIPIIFNEECELTK